jgi:glutathione synthase/RimK-type ligase-like ATP-grasp enzyme
MSKRYLLELAGRGAPMAPMAAVEPDADAIAAAMDLLGLERAVVKPEFGATGSGLSLVERGDAEELAAAAKKLGGPGFVQSLIPEISTLGETSLIFIAGEFSHAVTKRPKSGEILCQADHGGSTEAAIAPDWAISEARRVLTMVPGEPLYARVDAVILDHAFQLMEVELIEPELFFTYAPDGADRLATALLDRL